MKTKVKSNTIVNDWQSEDWKELRFRKKEFLDILRVLNRFYAMQAVKTKSNSSYLFREELVNMSDESFRVYLKRFGNYEYLVTAEIIEGNSSRMDSWIHVDGIKQERDELLSQGNLSHPVHAVISLSDLYSGACEETPEGFELPSILD